MRKQAVSLRQLFLKSFYTTFSFNNSVIFVYASELRGNYEWVASNPDYLEKYSGKWIAVVGKKLAAADSLKELLAHPGLKGEKHPFVTKVPLPEEAAASF